ncbi:hypothetical protein EX895_000543 [Sporisorium graminicola]|uniref:F-box domain-containing protein n=1 Tax=Sporisorium graminicola TaxID=280036 RepID=A0A4U7L096_9BASI|nr:hypothetical protein EX895_000543 [Sporisorium graminicola]TKY90545.1 hypothetical protein EX895_000543 [Sporisorium graminicola]
MSHNELQRDSRPRRATIASIEALPSELLFYLSRYLDLTGLIVFGTATSHALRATFAQFDRELLFLEPAHRLNLAEWREAARHLDSVGLAPVSCVTRDSSVAVTGLDGKLKGEDALSETVHQLTRDESLIDLHLLQSVLAFLAGQFSPRKLGYASKEQVRPNYTATPFREQSTSVNQIRCLHLTGWHGIAGAFLIQQLRTQPLLSQVCTVVKTDRADSRIWQQAAADDRMSENMPWDAGRGWSGQKHYQAAPVWLSRLGSTEEPYSSRLAFRQCTPTQIIVQVGKRRPRRPEQPYLKGEGLHMGYQGYCIDMASDARDAAMGDSDVHTVISASSAGPGPGPSCPAGTTSADDTVTHNDIPDGNARKRLHVILQGREVEDGNQNEEMFERSMVSCNHCKERILF